MSSVFNRNTMAISKENHDKHPCSEGHTWNMVIPSIDANKHEVQHQELINKPCDCQKFIWHEDLCGCAFKKWEAKLLPNPNY